MNKLFTKKKKKSFTLPFYSLGKVVASHAEGCRFDSRLILHRFILCTRRSRGTAHEGGVTACQLDLPSLTQLSVAGCCRLQLGVAHWATSVALLQVVDN